MWINMDGLKLLISAKADFRFGLLACTFNIVKVFLLLLLTSKSEVKCET